MRKTLAILATVAAVGATAKSGTRATGPACPTAQELVHGGQPGALTPSEIMAAMREGARAIKIFPCGNMGGPKYIKALKAPFPQADLIPTGGVNLQNAAEYIAAGAYALGAGADLVDLKALREGRQNHVRETAQKLVQAVHAARQEKSSASPVLT